MIATHFDSGDKLHFKQPTDFTLCTVFLNLKVKHKFLVPTLGMYHLIYYPHRDLDL